MKQCLQYAFSGQQGGKTLMAPAPTAECMGLILRSASGNPANAVSHGINRIFSSQLQHGWSQLQHNSAGRMASIIS